MSLKHLVFLLEEPSAQDFLEGILPRVIPVSLAVHFLVFKGKQDLERRLVHKMKHWVRPDSAFLVMRDQDGGDCRVIKQRLAALCHQAGRRDAVVRIACHELESFFIGDWTAVAEAFGQQKLARNSSKAKYRQPDELANASQEIKRAIPQYQKRAGARQISPLLVPERNRSRSFQVLFDSLQAIAEQA